VMAPSPFLKRASDEERVFLTWSRHAVCAVTHVIIGNALRGRVRTFCGGA
jgi:hypothetical protein